VKLIKEVVSVGWRRPDILSIQLEYARGIASTYSPDPGGLVPVPNASGGLLATTVSLAVEYGLAEEWILISEPPESGSIVSEWVRNRYGLDVHVTDLDERLGKKWSPMEPPFDLCDPQLDLTSVTKVNVVITQALLEHVTDPVQVIRALISILRESGILVIQTCNPYITLHRYPIDCLRYFPDFFISLDRYLPVKCERVEEVNGSIYVVLRKTWSGLS